MSDIINIDEHLEEKVEETKLDEIMDIFSTMEGDDQFGMESIGAILSMPDNEFNILAPFFLEELEKAMNTPADRILLQQTMREMGKTTQDFAQLQKEVLEEIDNNLSDEMPQNKVDFLKRMMTIITNTFLEADGTAKAIITIPIEKTSEEIQLPSYAHDGDAAMDLYATETVEILPGETKIIPTGIKTAIPKGYALLIQPRSGQSVKTKLRIANTPGLIDSGYRDEIGIIVENIEHPIQDIQYDFLESGKIVVKSIEHGKPYTIEKGQRIAQMRLVEVPSVNWLEVENIGEIEGDRGGGFGSSGQF